MNTPLQRIQTRNQLLEAQRVAAEATISKLMDETNIPTGYSYAEIRPALPEWNAVIVDFQYLNPMNIVTLRAPLNTPRAAQLLQLAGGAK